MINDDIWNMRTNTSDKSQLLDCIKVLNEYYQSIDSKKVFSLDESTIFETDRILSQKFTRNEIRNMSYIPAL